MQDDGGIVGHAGVVAVGGVVETSVEHLPADVGPAVPEELVNGAHAGGGRIEGRQTVFLHDQAPRPGGARGEDGIARDVVDVGIEVAVPGHGEGDVLIRKSGHRGVDDLLAGVE